MTNESGIYTIRIPQSTEAILVFSFVGFHTKEVKLPPNASVYNTKMEPSIKGLNDVVVIGYGTVKRKDLTGSVGEVKMADMEKAPVASFDQALAGRVAGVQVSAADGQPGSGMQIVIRGNNSVTQDNSPLYVVDGFPMESPDNNVINPAEIASIEVLKDASATAIYGARGANGVIMITTKQGKTGAPVVNYQAWVGMMQNIRQQEMLDPYEFVKYQLEMNRTLYEPVYLKDGKTLEDYRNVKGVNWQDQVFRNAFGQNHNISIRGGSDNTKYSLSGNIFSQDGIIINSGFRRNQGRIVIDQTITPKVKAGVNVNYTGTKTYGVFANSTVSGPASGPTASLMYSVWGFRPVTGSDEADGSLLEEPFDPDVDPLSEWRINPIISTRNEYNPAFNNTLISNAYLEVKPLKYFTLRITGADQDQHPPRDIQ